MTLKRFNSIVRTLDLTNGGTIAGYVLPVDSPDAEHAAVSTLANAASFTTKTTSGQP